MKKYWSMVAAAVMCGTIAMTGYGQGEGVAAEQNNRLAAERLVQGMTLDQKIGQMTLIKFTMLKNADNRVDWDNIKRLNLGALLVAGGEVPTNPEQGEFQAGSNDPADYMQSTQANWLKVTNQVKLHLPTVTYHGQTVEIPMLLGIDAVHGNQTILGNTLYPQNIGLSMTHNPALLKQLQHWTAVNVMQSGFNWAYAPTVAVSHNPHWGRYSETLGDQLSWVRQYGSAMTAGIQQPLENGQHVLATAKHFLGDGATVYGADEGNDAVVGGFENFLNVNKQGYLGAVNDADTGSIMVSYSAINHRPMLLNHDLITGQLRSGTLLGQPHKGLIVSDYGAVDKASSQGLPATPDRTDYQENLATAVNAGLDLFMLTNTSGSYSDAVEMNKSIKFQQILKADVDNGSIPMSRIDAAVAQIITTKMDMGLLSYDSATDTWTTHQPVLPVADKEGPNQTQIQLATQAAEQSMVLLKNQKQVLPLNPNQVKYIVLVGESRVNQLDDQGERHQTLYPNYDNIGAQNGGWTLAWQGIEGNAFWQGEHKTTSGATTILEGLHAAFPGAEILYPHYTRQTDWKSIAVTRAKFLAELALKHPEMNAENTVVIGTIAEPPYSEFMGDIGVPYCANDSEDFTNGCLYNLHLNPYLPDQQPQTLRIGYNPFDLAVIKAVQLKSGHHAKIPVVTVLLSGRPRIINAPLKVSDSMIAAWLPGTSGGTAIANALSGEYHFCNGQRNGNRCAVDAPNTLTVPWVRTDHQLDNYPVYTDSTHGIPFYAHPLFPVGYGLAD